MNIVKIYIEDEMIESFTIESEKPIDSSKYVKMWNCKEEIYIDDQLIDTKYHSK
jgi:hypothetical protein